MIPVRKVMEEICPSPVARKLRTKRRAPKGRSDWSGCGTMEGLNSAADSKEYSQTKYDPINSFLCSEISSSFDRKSRTCSNRSRKDLWIRRCRWENSADTSSRSGPTWSSGGDMILAIILRDRSGSSCLNGRRRTRDWSGRRTVAVRRTRIEVAAIMDWLRWGGTSDG